MPRTANSTRHTWLSPYLAAWLARFEGHANPGLLAKYLAPLEREHGPEKTLKHFANYLVSTEVQFANLARFAASFGVWKSPNPDAWRKDKTYKRPDETMDQYWNRMAAM